MIGCRVAGGGKATATATRPAPALTPATPPRPQDAAYDGATVLITGATGFVGKVVLEKLLYSLFHRIEKVYVVLRPVMHPRRPRAHSAPRHQRATGTSAPRHQRATGTSAPRHQRATAPARHGQRATRGARAGGPAGFKRPSTADRVASVGRTSA